MTMLYTARWVLPISSPAISAGALAIEDQRIIAVGEQSDLSQRFPAAPVRNFGEAAILPGLVNAHSHLELTAMRGFLDAEESDFAAWLKKLTKARLERMTADDLYVAAVWGACEAVRAGVTCVADASDSAQSSMAALGEVGLRGVVYQESFGPDPRLAKENFETLAKKIAALRELETSFVRAGVSPHAPYTVCAAQLEMIADFSRTENLPVMMHAAESRAEELLMREGQGPFAEGLARRGIEWQAPGCSTVEYLERQGILEQRPLLAHCINVNDKDIETIRQTGSRVAHCPRSNAKLGHGHAPFAKLFDAEIDVGLGSDSVASNNTCDVLEEARFALLLDRAGAVNEVRAALLGADQALHAATLGGARALGLQGIAGELREGLQADFVAVSLAGAHQLPVYEPASALVFASSGRDVIMTVIAGREVYSDGRVTTVDENRFRERIRELALRMGT